MTVKGGCCGDCLAQIHSFFSPVAAEGTLARSARVSLIVGTILALINQGGVIFQGIPPVWWKLVLTYAVPFIVFTHGSVSTRLSESTREESTTPTPTQSAIGVQPPKTPPFAVKIDQSLADVGTVAPMV